AKLAAGGCPRPLAGPTSGNVVVARAVAEQALSVADRAALDVAAAPVRLSNQGLTVRAVGLKRRDVPSAARRTRRLQRGCTIALLLAPRRSRRVRRRGEAWLGEQRPSERVGKEAGDPSCRLAPLAELRRTSIPDDFHHQRLCPIGLAEHDRQTFERRLDVMAPSGEEPGEAVGLLP